MPRAQQTNTLLYNPFCIETYNIGLRTHLLYIYKYIGFKTNIKWDRWFPCYSLSKQTFGKRTSEYIQEVPFMKNNYRFDIVYGRLNLNLVWC